MAAFQIACQAYTVRNEMKTDFRGTLSAVAGMGYRGVEMGMNFGGMEPAELAKFLQSINLAVAGIHVDQGAAADPANQLYAYAKAIGAPYVSISLAWDVDKDWNAAIETTKKVATAARQNGIGFTYHNHSQEFQKIDGKYALDILYERTDPKLVECELDTFWIKTGGEDPASYIRKYKGRTPQIHLKDMDAETKSFTEVGAGIIDLEGVFKAIEYVGAKWVITEQDRNWKPDGIASARISIDNLRKKGLV